MPSSEFTAGAIMSDLRQRGYAQVASMSRGEYDALCASLGRVVGEERIALRPGAHAYVAKPGPVPLHTDQPEVGIIGWWCEVQDKRDGASLLLDARPAIEALPLDLRDRLRQVHLLTPPRDGGPPTERWPVLRPTHDGDAIFCSPWLRSAIPDPEHERALATFREILSRAIREGRASVRLASGEALFVDNQRVLHGRGEIATDSRRCLRRKWVVTSPRHPVP